MVDDLKPVVQVDLSDAGAGISGGGIDFKLDGVSKIVEWHPVHRWIRYVPDKPMSVGTHKVIVTVTGSDVPRRTRAVSQFLVARAHLLGLIEVERGNMFIEIGPEGKLPGFRVEADPEGKLLFGNIIPRANCRLKFG